MNKDLQRRLQEEVKKSGFPLELDVIERLREQEWLVFPNLPFTDDFGGIHEIDALAMICDIDTEVWRHGTVAQDLIIECKSSTKKPWVFFEEVWDPLSCSGLVANLQYLSNLSFKEPYTMLAGCMNTALQNHHYNSYDIPRSLTYFEALGKDAGTNIYKAVMNIWLSINFYKKFHDAQNLSKERFRKKLVHFLHGVILFDGTLVIAKKNNNDFEFSEVPHIMLRTINCLTDKRDPFGSGRETIIDVVRKDYLEKYISICRNDLTLCTDHLNQISNTAWVEDSEP